MIIDTNIPSNTLFAKNVIPYGAKLVSTVILGAHTVAGDISIGDTITGDDSAASGTIINVSSSLGIYSIQVQMQTSASFTLEDFTTSDAATGTLFSVNENVDKVSADTELRARLYIETAIGSGTYEFVTERKGFPDASGWTFVNFHGILDDGPLKYSMLNLSDHNVQDPNVCRKIKVEFYQYIPSQHSFHNEIYNSGSELAPIHSPGEEFSRYRLVIHSTDPEVVDQVTGCIADGSNTQVLQSPGYVNDVQGDETHRLYSQGGIREYFNAPPKVKIEIYNYPQISSVLQIYSVSNERSALKGGIDIIRSTFGSDIYLGTPDGQFLLTPDGQKILFI